MSFTAITRPDYFNQQLELDFTDDYLNSTMSSTVTASTASGSGGFVYTNTGTGGFNHINTNSGGFVYTTGGTSGPLTTGINGTSPWSITDSTQPSSLKVSGDIDVDGDIKIGGVKLSERFDVIEKRLNILRPHVKLEERWDKLRELGEQYRAMEKELLEMEHMWDLLSN